MNTSAKQPDAPLDAQLDVLFVSEKELWPLDQGFRIRGSNMSKALVEQGLHVGTANMACTDLADVPTDMRDRQLAWPIADASQKAASKAAWSGFGGWLRHKLASHQGVDVEAMAGVRALVEKHRPRVVVALGQHGPMMLRGVKDLDCQCIWYAADEPVRFQLSCMAKEPLTNWPERLRQMLFYAALETVFVRGNQGAVAVSPLDAKLLKWIGGAKSVAMIRNGVDLEYFKPKASPTADASSVSDSVADSTEDSAKSPSLVFWGRLDFEPNIDAIGWFARDIWPALIKQKPEATWSIVGKFPDAKVREIAKLPGVKLAENVPDIRPYAHGSSLTILPMRCGGGIKNKLLEAAAMARPVVVSPRAIQGLPFSNNDQPVHVCQSTQDWITDILHLWNDAQARHKLGQRAHQWVSQSHSWSAAASTFCQWALLEDKSEHKPDSKLENQRVTHTFTQNISTSSDVYKEAA